MPYAVLIGKLGTLFTKNEGGSGAMSGAGRLRLYLALENLVPELGRGTTDVSCVVELGDGEDRRVPETIAVLEKDADLDHVVGRKARVEELLPCRRPRIPEILLGQEVHDVDS